MSNPRTRSFSILIIFIILGSVGGFYAICSNVQLERYRGRAISDYWQVTDYEHTQEKSDAYPVGVADVVTFPLER